ncbi:VOC family protein [Pedobacter sp. 22163]|uniref:VOC family protein n=1 Tax=Pedobacter sp. 22163 TaxID=3453883 RepID=UPI003F827EC0
MEQNQLIRMDNMGIVVASLDNAISFFTEIGLKLEGRATIEGEWAGKVTPDGHSRLEISQFLSPVTISDHREAPVNSLGYLRVMFTVSDIDELLPRLEKHGATLVGEVVEYENVYKLCYIRGSEGLLIGLAQELHKK